MKKIAIITAACMLFANVAFAAGTLTLTLGTTPSTGKSVYGAKTGSTASTSTALIGKTSTGVGIGMNSAATGYSVITQHLSGTKAYGSAHSSTSIFVHEVTAGTAVGSGTTAANSADFTAANGWSSL